MKLNIEIELTEEQFETLKNLYEMQSIHDFRYAIHTTKFVSDMNDYGGILNNLKSNELINIYESDDKFKTLALGCKLIDSYSRLTPFGVMLVEQNK